MLNKIECCKKLLTITTTNGNNITLVPLSRFQAKKNNITSYKQGHVSKQRLSVVPCYSTTCWGRYRLAEEWDLFGCNLGAVTTLKILNYKAYVLHVG